MPRSLDAQTVTKHDWYYEMPGHLLFVHQAHAKDGSYLGTDQIKIPWRKIEASLKRVKARRHKLPR